MRKTIKNNVSWIGKIDWEIRQFHGHELSTHQGSSYNSYLIEEEKTVIIDTVWGQYSQDYLEQLRATIDINKVDYIVANHAESDHSGSLAELMKLLPGKPIYCTQAGVRSLQGHYHEDWNFQVVKTGDRLPLGNGKELVFIEAPMLHWPDSMFTYLTGDNILFSNDAFGQHFASDDFFNDLVDQSILFNEAMKYYANILTPFSQFVTKKIEELTKLGVPVDIIAPSHGIIWRDNPLQIVSKYAEWADMYQENQITIVYDTMWNGTKHMAEAIADGIKAVDDKVEVRLFNSGSGDRNDIITEIFKSKILVVGSPTINKGISASIAALLEAVKGLAFKNKKAASFGAYGWSGEATTLIKDWLEVSGFKMVDDGLKMLWSPSIKELDLAKEYGKKLAGN